MCMCLKDKRTATEMDKCPDKILLIKLKKTKKQKQTGVGGGRGGGGAGIQLALRTHFLTLEKSFLTLFFLQVCE